MSDAKSSSWYGERPANEHTFVEKKSLESDLASALSDLAVPSASQSECLRFTLRRITLAFMGHINDVPYMAISLLKDGRSLPVKRSGSCNAIWAPVRKSLVYFKRDYSYLYRTN